MAKSGPKRNSIKKKSAPKKTKASLPKTTSKKDCDDGVCDITKPKVVKTQSQPESSSCCLWSRIKKWFS